MVVLHELCLLIHLLCLGVYGASSLGGIVLDRRLWLAVEQGRDAEALAFAQTGALFGRFSQGAAVLTLLTGLGMLASTNFVQWGQLWLYGKIILFVALGACGGAIGGRAGRRLIAVLSERVKSPPADKATGVQGELAALRSTFATFHVVMPVMLVAVLALVAIRP
jgi:hypothetical protein